MNKAFEKILERLEELRQEQIEELCKHKDFTSEMQSMRGHNILQDAKKIVQEVVEEYNNGWILCSERLPEEHKLYDITFKNSTGIHSDSAIYNPYLKRWLWDADETELVENEVLAWAEKREPYRRKRCEDAKGDTEVD